MCGSQRLALDVLTAPYPCSEAGSPVVLLLHMLGHLASELLVVSCPLLSSGTKTGAGCYHVRFFLDGDLSSGLHPCAVDTLPTEPLPSPSSLILNKLFAAWKFAD